MGMPHQSLIENHRRELLQLWESNQKVFSDLLPFIRAHAEEIVDEFYEVLSSDSQASSFLNTQLVNQRLRKGLMAWLNFTFNGDHSQTLEEFLEYQAHLGKMHADIGIPLNLFLMGLRVIKSATIRRIAGEDDRYQLGKILYVDALFDLVLAIVAESYNDEHGELMSDLQRMRMSIPAENLQLVCEQMRSRLLMWFTSYLSVIHQNSGLPSGGKSLQPLKDSEIGMWLTHKAALLFPANEALGKLNTVCGEIDVKLVQALNLRQRGEFDEFSSLLNELENQVKKADWLLGELGREVSEMEGRTDPLTHLFNRRHLTTVLNFESRQAHQRQDQFALLLIDIDHFKSINDRHGHDAGDLVLKKFSDLISSIVRSSDFVFRYGGEEFLVLLPSTNETKAINVAEKLRSTIKQNPVKLPDGSCQELTISCGVALSGGELNYERIIKRADQALYQAKQQGRNICVLAPPPQ